MIYQRVNLLGTVAPEIQLTTEFYAIYTAAVAGRVRYLIRNRTTGEYEHGLGTLSLKGGAAAQVSRDTVLGNHLGNGNGVYFNAGSKDLLVWPETWPQTAPFASQLAPAAWTGDQNNYNPPGLAGTNWLRIDINGANRNLTGLAGGYPGRELIVESLGSPTFGLILHHESGSSTAANRFWMQEGANVTITGLSKSAVSGAMLKLVYCGTRLRWRVWPMTL